MNTFLAYSTPVPCLSCPPRNRSPFSSGDSGEIARFHYSQRLRYFEFSFQSVSTCEDHDSPRSPFLIFSMLPHFSVCFSICPIQMPVDFKTYPVIVFLEGEMFTHSNPGRYPAEDLAAEGLVVVSVHYRLNIFGSVCVSIIFPHQDSRR